MCIYSTRYDKLINYYKENLTEGYVERHHIIPKCMGGTNEKSNLVLLPVKAHFIAHYLLCKAYPNNEKLLHAFSMMTVNNPYQNRKMTGKLYELAKKSRADALSGKPRPEWVKEKLRRPKKNKENYKKPKSKQHAENVSKSLTGKKKSPEHISNMVSSQRKFQKSRTDNMNAKKHMYRNLYIQSELSRKEFYKQHPELSRSTLIRYLKGL